MKTLFLLLLTCTAFAHDSHDASHRPKGFPHQNGQAVFVDFEEATYDITYDLDRQSSRVSARIKMHVIEEGFPVFDLVEEPTLVTINGDKVQAPTTKTPAGETTVRVINKKLRPGTYDLVVEAPITTLIQYTKGSVKSAFWVTDLDDRMYLERYLPVNLEFDRVKMTFNLKFKGLRVKHQIFANGDVKWLSGNRAQVKFPDHFTMNSLYFHTAPSNSVEVVTSVHKSVSGRDIPITVYKSLTGMSEDLEELKKYAHSTLVELESDYGAFPHSSLTIYSANLSSMGLGGMEYAGATATNYSALSHEIFHSYFARAVAPANGNAGWIDESLASWRDNGYPRGARLWRSSRMAAHDYYTRHTDRLAYSFGSDFMAFLDEKFSSQGGLKPFMNKLLETKRFQPLFTEEFISEMESFYGEKVNDLFQTYVFDVAGNEDYKSDECHNHRKGTPAQLNAFL